MRRNNSKEIILVFRAGLLGDTLVALPALWCLKKAYPRHRIVYVCQRVKFMSHVSAHEILKSSGLVDCFLFYDTYHSRFKNMLSGICLLIRMLSMGRANLAVILESPYWGSKTKYIITWLSGAKKILEPSKDAKQITGATCGGRSMEIQPHISDTLVDVLRNLDIDLPKPQKGHFELSFGEQDIARVNQWMKSTGDTSTPKPWIGVCPWSNMPNKRWPIDRYIRVITRLIDKYNITPFILGGQDECKVGEYIIKECGCGFVASGKLSISEGICLLSKCELYLGNDTGVMHMAVSAGIRCVALFSARDVPGRWYPYGQDHIVLRGYVDCEGCMLKDCPKDNLCIKMNSIDEVFDACCQVLSSTPSHKF